MLFGRERNLFLANKVGHVDCREQQSTLLATWLATPMAYAIVDGCDCVGSIVLLSQELLLCDVCRIDRLVDSNPRFGSLIQIRFDC
jgi:hypothetical protein